MPWVVDGDPADALDPTAVTRFGQDFTDAVGSHLRDAVKSRTPISTARVGVAPIGDPLDAMHVHAADPLTNRERPPGTLMASIEKGRVTRHSSPLGRGWQIKVGTRDPVGPLVEDDTRAHVIRPTPEHMARARAEGKSAALRIFWRGAVHFFGAVHHPGTRGAHMFARGSAWTALELGSIAVPYLERFGRDVTRHRAFDAGVLQRF
jgi:hypothetical protein